MGIYSGCQALCAFIKVIIGVTPIRVLITLLITYLLSSLPLQVKGLQALSFELQSLNGLCLAPFLALARGRLGLGPVLEFRPPGRELHVGRGRCRVQVFGFRVSGLGFWLGRGALSFLGV